MATKHSVGDRLYVMSNNAVHPTKRTEETETLVFISHGFWKRPGKNTKAAGFGEVWFACPHNGTTDPGDFEDALTNSDWGIFRNDREHRYRAGADIVDYTYKKESDKDAKKRHKGKETSFEFVNQSYIEFIYPKTATYDLACLHNTWKSGRTLQLADIFKTFAGKDLVGKYTRLLIGSCREEDES